MNEIQEYGEGFFWKNQEGSIVLLGITQKALDLVGNIEELDLPDSGEELQEGDPAGEVKGKNSTIEFLVPFALRVLEVNEEILQQPGIIEDDPTGDAWIIKGEALEG